MFWILVLAVKHHSSPFDVDECHISRISSGTRDVRDPMFSQGLVWVIRAAFVFEFQVLKTKKNVLFTLYHGLIRFCSGGYYFLGNRDEEGLICYEWNAWGEKKSGGKSFGMNKKMALLISLYSDSGWSGELGRSLVFSVKSTTRPSTLIDREKKKPGRQNRFFKSRCNIMRTHKAL